MKVDWKKLSKMSGYLLFKKGYTNYLINDQAKWHHEDARKTYKRIIGIAQSITFHTGKKSIFLRTIHMNLLLLKWEEERTYCWLNYYISHKFNKSHSNSLKSRNLVKYFKKHAHDKTHRLHRIADAQQSLRVKSGKKARWNKHQREYKLRERER